jgi:hypothetical protein
MSLKTGLCSGGSCDIGSLDSPRINQLRLVRMGSDGPKRVRFPLAYQFLLGICLVSTRCVTGPGPLKSHFRFLSERQETYGVFQRAAAGLGQNDIPGKSAALE